MMQGGPHGVADVTTYTATSEQPLVNLRRDVLSAVGAIRPCRAAPGQWPVGHRARCALERHQW